MAEPVPSPYLDEAIFAQVSASLDLREPNRDALRAIVDKLGDWEVAHSGESLEVVVDSAVGVGKTYVAAAVVDYFAQADGTRNFAIITPGTVVTDKTIDNFTAGTAKSLVGGMDATPVLITSENFDTPAMRAILDDPSRVKLFVFNVQALLTPREGSKTRRRTHSFQEGLGRGLYEHLATATDLVILADEHHTYYGPAFSKAIRDLHPRLHVGLTGTPHPKSVEQVIFSYPLAAAIRDQFVKVPVLVGRRDDRTEPQVQLADGAILLDEKQKALDAYCAAQALPPVNAVMLVLCQTIEEARTTADAIESNSYANGRFKGKVLEIHSDKKGERLQDDLRALANVEDPVSPVRVIVAVDKLKEGWDVKNVFVLASLRASVSQILTEQTLGRGLRLPFGAYTGFAFLDSLEVLAHERYEQLLKKRDVFRERLIAYRHQPEIVLDRNGQPQLVITKTRVDATPTVIESVTDDDADQLSPPPGKPIIASVEDRKDVGARAALIPELHPARSIEVPYVRRQQTVIRWSLAKITDLGPFRFLARKIAADPNTELRRTALTGEIFSTDEGLVAQIVATDTADHIIGTQPILPLETLRQRIRSAVLASDIVDARPIEKTHVDRIVDAVFNELGDNAEAVLSASWERAAARIVDEIRAVIRHQSAGVSFSESVTVETPFGQMAGKPEGSTDRYGFFRRTHAYEGWRRGLYHQAWFDSQPEREVANIVDQDSLVDVWVRVQTGQIPLAWNMVGSGYNPDFVVVDTDGTHYLVEVKADNQIDTPDVKSKADAARQWANVVNADPNVNEHWEYVLVGERDIKDAKASWAMLRSLAR